MRVLVMCEYSSLNGGEHSLLEVARRMRSLGIGVVVAAPRRGPLAEALEQCRLPHRPLQLFDPQGVRYARARVQRQITDCIAESQVDLVHANSLSMSRVVGWAAQQAGVPSIGHLRDIMRLSKASIEDLNRHGCLLAVSAATRQWYVDAGLSATKTRVVYNGVDVERFRPRPADGWLQRELNIPAASLLVGGVGQFGMRKGVDLLLEAAATVADEREDVHFLYAGARYSQKPEAVAYEQLVRQKAASGNLRGRFHFLGVRNDVDRILNELAIYVHAARQEPLGRVLLEAGAAGAAIVATDVGGTREIFPVASRAALLVPPESPLELAAAVRQLLHAPQTRQAMGMRARQRVAAAFPADLAAQTLAHWYRETAASHR